MAYFLPQLSYFPERPQMKSASLWCRRIVGATASMLMAVGIAAAPAQAQGIPNVDQLTAGSSNAANAVQQAAAGAANDANRAWNDMARQVNGTVPSGSSVPYNPFPAPGQPAAPAAKPASGPWRATAGQPVAPGHNGEIRVGNRSYLIWVPRGYNASRPTPVMVGYSAYQDSTENFRNYSRLRESNVGRDAIIVYPRAIGTSWEGSATSATRPGEDIRFVRAMINDVQRYYNIDLRRIYATGMSTGGGMAAVSACHMADLFAGVAGVSGAYYWPVNSNCQNIPVAFLAYHGTNDTLTNYHGGVRRGTRYLGVPELFSSYERRNGCNIGRINKAPLSNNATRVSATGCKKPVQAIKVHGSNHFWWYNPSTANDMWAVLSRVSK